MHMQDDWMNNTVAEFAAANIRVAAIYLHMFVDDSRIEYSDISRT